MAIRKNSLRSLGILLLAVIANGSVLFLVFQEVPHPFQRRRDEQQRNTTGSRNAGDRTRPASAARRDHPQKSAYKARNSPNQDAGPTGDDKGQVEVVEADETSRAAESALSNRTEESSIRADASTEKQEALKAGKDMRAAVLASYESQRAQAADRVDDQKRLAAWCDSQGLWDQARTHWEAVLRLASDERTARRRLGYRQSQGKWVLDTRLAEESLQKKADAYWSRELTTDHKRIDGKGGGETTRKAYEAASRVEAVTDPLAVPSLWRVFAGHHRHHRLLAGVLSAIKTRLSSQMLAAIAVYSFDEKARVTATRALSDRNPDEFDEQLVLLLNHPLRYRVGEVADGSGGWTRALLIEGQTANYQLLYPSMAQQQTAACFGSFYVPGITSQAAARQYNREQSRIANALTNLQIESDKAAVESLNQSIARLNGRVVRVLSETTGASLGSDPESWRRWLAERQGTTYQPLAAWSTARWLEMG